MSAADANAEDAFELLRAGDTDRSTVLALLAIRWELRTANLLAAAGSLRILDEGRGFGQQSREVAAIRSEIRRELDLDGEADQ